MLKVSLIGKYIVIHRRKYGIVFHIIWSVPNVLDIGFTIKCLVCKHSWSKWKKKSWFSTKSQHIAKIWKIMFKSNRIFAFNWHSMISSVSTSSYRMSLTWPSLMWVVTKGPSFLLYFGAKSIYLLVQGIQVHLSTIDFRLFCLKLFTGARKLFPPAIVIAIIRKRAAGFICKSICIALENFCFTFWHVVE